jgi:hypothetical protein
MTSYEDWYNEQLPPSTNKYRPTTGVPRPYPRSRYIDDLFGPWYPEPPEPPTSPFTPIGQ